MMKYENLQGKLWYESILEHPETLPFFFTYRGREYRGFGGADIVCIDRKAVSNGKRTENTLIFSLRGELTITLLVSFYPTHGVTEWTVSFENTSVEDSGILTGLKTELTENGDKPVLRGILGDHENQYRPYVHDLSEKPVLFTSDSGRPTHINFPYFNLECGDGGIIYAIGWAGTWTASFTKQDDRTQVTLVSCNGLCTYLKPGEKIRTALFVRAPYTVRDEDWATNFWRSWFIECNMPKQDASGAPVRPFSTAGLAGDTGLPNSDGSISERWFTWKRSLDCMLEENLHIDYRWFDAGWYTAPDGSSPQEDWWGTVGTWELDKQKWPGNSFRESTDYARAHGMKTLMWFEPERVTSPQLLAERYGYNRDWAIEREGHREIVNNIGDEKCLEWTTERICKVLRENRVEMYREDNNCDPADLWNYLDEREGENRRGITECRLVANHYRMWDSIIACTLEIGGDGFVDSCASGGGRNDLESLRRGIPLLRSDADRTTTALRLSMSYGFNRWIPFCGAATKEKQEQLTPDGVSDAYTWRASYLPVLNVFSRFYLEKKENFEILRFGLREWEQIRDYLLKDYYVHTPWHSPEDTGGFTAFSYFDPEKSSGIVLAFRQETCAENSLDIRLKYLDENCGWILRDADTGEEYMLPAGSRELKLCLDTPRSSRMLWVRKA